jgi:hypothetical protein
MSSAAGDEYELVVLSIASQLANRSGVDTTRLEHDVNVPGRATHNQIDVLWDFTDAAGNQRRLVFEAKNYAKSLSQGILHAFRSVVDDIQSEDRPVIGVMVTRTGYQNGSKNVADTYDLLVLELRSPTQKDVANRVDSVQVKFNAVASIVTDFAFDFAAVLDFEALQGQIPTNLFRIQKAGSNECAQLIDILADGELGTPDAPRALHQVQLVFDPPATLMLSQTPVATINAVGATVGCAAAPPVTVTIGGLDSVALMLRNALTGARLWFGAKGQIWSTDS